MIAKTCICAVLIGCAASIGAIVMAGENPAGGVSETWSEHLSAKERRVLTAMKDQQRQQLETFGRETSIDVSMLDMIRKEFEAGVIAAAPPIDGVKSVPYDANGVKGLWLKPEGANENRALLFLHAGGFAIGSPRLEETMTGYLAKRAGIACFSLDYPLSPEAVYPAALDNAVQAYRMLLEEGFAPGDVVLAGSSAGGGLALSTLLRLRQEGLPMPAGAYLLSPWTDLSNSFPSHREKLAAEPSLGIGLVRTYAELYTNGRDLRDSFISPAFADLKGLPPLLLHVGSHEVLLDDTLTIVRNAALADVPVSVKIWPGYFHVFQMFPAALEGSREALDEGAAFFNAVMDKTWLRPAVEKEER